MYFKFGKPGGDAEALAACKARLAKVTLEKNEAVQAAFNATVNGQEQLANAWAQGYAAALEPGLKLNPYRLDDAL